MEKTLRGVVEPLATLRRGAGSPGEERAARIIAEMLEGAGAAGVQIDEEQFYDGYARVLLPLAAVGLAASWLVARGRRVVGGALAVGAGAAIVDDVENGKRWWRKATSKPKTTWNVVAECGDPKADRTLVVMAHHDAAPTGAIFDPAGQRKLAARYPDLIQKRDVSAPFWWPAAAGPLFITLAALFGSRVFNRLGTGLALLNTALGLDIARHRIVPGANDNLSAVAALVGLAERLRDRPVSGVRVVLVSCGAEEVLQGGIYGFVERHLRPLDPATTWVLNLDSIGSPELIMVEGEGPFVMHRFDQALRDRVATVCEAATGAPLRRGILARASSDSIIPSRAGYPTAMLASWEPDTKLISNYHLMSDTPENLRYETIERAVVVAEALARDLSAAS